MPKVTPMFALRKRIQQLLIILTSLMACLFAAVSPASAQIFIEDFEDQTLFTGPPTTTTTTNFGTIANGIITFSDTDASTRSRLVVRPATPYADPVLTYSFDIKAPVTVGTIGASPSNELRFRAGIGAGNNTLSSSEFIYEVLLYRTANGGNVGAYTNNGNESLFIVANNQNASLNFSSPIDSSPVTLSAYQYIAYIKNNANSSFSLQKAASAMVDMNGATDGVGTIARWGFGSSNNGDSGTFAMDNAIVVTGVSFLGATPPMLGDVNGDNQVTIADFNIIQANFRQSPKPRSLGDLTGDQLVSLADFKQWKTAYTGGGGSLAGLDLDFLNVPEPSSILLALLLMTGITSCRSGCSGLE